MFIICAWECCVKGQAKVANGIENNLISQRSPAWVLLISSDAEDFYAKGPSFADGHGV